MAESIAAFGLAANAIQFVDFGSKILAVGYRLYRSNATGTVKNSKLQEVTQDLLKVADGLEASMKPLPQHFQTSLSTNDIQLRKLAQKCRDTCLELLAVLNKLKVQDQSRKWDTLRIALRTVWSEDKIEALQRSLDRYRQELVLRILLALRNEASKPTQSLAHGQINGINTSRQGLGGLFLEYIKQTKSWQENYMAECKKWQDDLIGAIYQDTGSARRQPASLHNASEDLQRGFIDLLRFPEMTDRHNRIAEAHEKTFRWVLSDARRRNPQVKNRSWASLVDWLENATSLYWITGKAGSGKSTLMKYIYHDDRTFQHLRIWASGVQLVAPAFFFWNSGTSFQTSQLGMLQTLLSQILSERPSLIVRLFPERWETYSLFRSRGNPWTQFELEQALKKLSNEGSELSTKFCFFIDGLDEFSGDHVRLISLLQSLVVGRHIKVCVSSRPWVVFEDALGCAPCLRLEDLTYSDIQRYVHYNFHQNPDFSKLEHREPEYASRLLEEIVRKAAGVFLWVNLVTTSLLAGLSNADRVTDLQRRLDLLPPELENLYQKMLDSLDPFYLEHASEFFQFIRTTPDRSALFLSYGDDPLDTLLRQKIQPLDVDEEGARIDVIRRRLNSRCKGLLEVCESTYLGLPREALPFLSDPRGHTTPTLRVEYLHRTVKDFIHGTDVWEWLLAANKEPYNPDLAICKAYVMTLKAMRSRSLERTTFWSAILRCIKHAQRASMKMRSDSEQEKLCSLLDEVNRAAGEHIRIVKEEIKNEGAGLKLVKFCGLPLGPSQISDAESHDQIPYIGEEFLSFMVKVNMRSYVRLRAQEGCLVNRNSKTWPLLNDACLRDSSPQAMFETFWKESFDSFPSPQMIDLLLEKGADPNAKIAGLKGTVWDNIRQSNNLGRQDLEIILSESRMKEKLPAMTGGRSKSRSWREWAKRSVRR